MGREEPDDKPANPLMVKDEPGLTVEQAVAILLDSNGSSSKLTLSCQQSAPPQSTPPLPTPAALPDGRKCRFA